MVRWAEGGDAALLAFCGDLSEDEIAALGFLFFVSSSEESESDSDSDSDSEESFEVCSDSDDEDTSTGS